MILTLITGDGDSQFSTDILFPPEEAFEYHDNASAEDIWDRYADWLYPRGTYNVANDIDGQYALALDEFGDFLDAFPKAQLVGP